MSKVLYEKGKDNSKNWDKELNMPKSEVVYGMPDTVPLIDIDHEEYIESYLEIDLKDLYAPNSKYSPEQKIAAASAYLITGTSRQAQKYCGVRADIIRDWKTRSSWWPSVFAECKKKKQDELDAQFSQTVHIAMGQLNDRIINGDEKIGRDGSVIRLGIGGKDLATIVGILYDKRALLRGDPTSRVENNKGKDAMALLQNKFEDIARQLESKTVDATHEVIKEDS